MTHIDAVPARCAELLAAGDADCGVVPIIEYQRIAGAKLVPDVCVGSREKVRSVLLVSRLNNLKKIRSVSLDESSRTSATLTKVIFQEFLGIEPAWVTSSPDISRMLRDSDAALMIGDPAMTVSRDGLNVWDLATLWHDFTGTGFVFAMWMAKENVRSELLSVDFASAKEEGVNAIDEIVDDYERRLRLPAHDLRDYLINNITFDLDNDLKSGMQRYFELALRHGLINRLRPLEYFRMHDGG